MEVDRELDDILAHYGVKGMKWGVRRSQAQLDRAAGRKTARANRKAAKKAPKPKSEDAAAAEAAKAKAKKGGVGSLSNAELQTLTNRLNLEQQYSRLEAKQISPGQKFFNDMMMTLAKKQAAEFTNAQISNLLKGKK